MRKFGAIAAAVVIVLAVGGCQKIANVLLGVDDAVQKIDEKYERITKDIDNSIHDLEHGLSDITDALDDHDSQDSGVAHESF